jgi:hypothetical protein
MAGNRDIRDAHERLQLAWGFVQSEWPKRHPKDPMPFLTEVYRSPDVQRALYAQGREKLANVNSLRRAVKLPPLTEDENRRKVTWAMPGHSKHNPLPAEAIDAMFARGKVLLDDVRLYKQYADLMREFDPKIRWGGDWDGDGRSDDERKLDMPHCEI